MISKLLSEDSYAIQTLSAYDANIFQFSVERKVAFYEKSH